jgi:hypothetical protein
MRTLVHGVSYGPLQGQLRYTYKYFPACLMPVDDVAQKDLRDKAGVFCLVFTISMVENKFQFDL